MPKGTRIVVDVKKRECREEICEVPPVSLEELKGYKKEDIKKKAVSLFALYPDWKILRHQEQRETPGGTSMSEKEYAAFLKVRQAIRDASNQIEQEIDALKKEKDINAFDVENHPAWGKI